MLSDLLVLVPLGVVAGLLSGLLGIGGGLVFSPILLLVGLPPHQALATSTLAIVPTTLGGTWLHLRQGRVQPAAGLAIGLSAALSGLLFSQLGGLLSGWQLLGLQALMYATITLTITPRSGPELEGAEAPAPPWPALALVGSVAGLAGGLLGVGGGLLMVPLMMGVLRLPVREAIRLSTLAVLCSATAASVTFLALAKAQGAIALTLGGTASVAARWSAARLDRVPETLLVQLLRGLTALLALDSGRRALSLLLG
ncbi:sulfite exporter TauE/SafE family protein [Synechococcus sp. RedBA-s]|uniref:sulfite exporter TauE/SafE family protein n=1 Tax=Synechococcus sp. RedBA-s TaxID=2823741 RepID=UPI0020CF3BC0|nr:sulfite exporter TauE/SafE family protein [Synechococcus sp. RedBA-s]MCP9801729.1 sulfite exporter TauE/SafE family protein [Synechococcus sp. RedBA-s]